MIFAYPLDEVSKLLNTFHFLRIFASHCHLLNSVLKEGSHLQLHFQLLFLLCILQFNKQDEFPSC